MNYIIINYNHCFNIFIANMIMAINTKNVDISLIKELQTILLAYSLYNTIIDVIPYLVFILKVLLYSLLYSISVLTYYFLVTTFTFFQRCPPSLPRNRTHLSLLQLPLRYFTKYDLKILKIFLKTLLLPLILTFSPSFSSSSQILINQGVTIFWYRKS